MKNNIWNQGMRVLRRAGLWLCMTVVCAGFTSCGDDFDDSEINKRLDTLEQRVADLEQSLSEQINSLKELINGKMTVSSWALDSETGIYTILLSDGSSLSMAKADATTPRIGVAQDSEGAYYWTLDGEPMRNAAGDQIYVESTTTPSVRVNLSTGEWEISADGGATYLSTGIKAGDNASLIAKVDDDETYVYFTLSDGTKIRVAKTVDFKIAMLAGKQYFQYDQTRTVKLDMSGVKKMAVYSKPDGWKASIANDELSITAPGEANDSAEESGSVIVQAWFNDGTSDISEVGVAIGEAPHEISVDANMNISISTSTELKDNWDKYGNWMGLARGVVKYDEFSEKWVKDYIANNTRIEWSGDYNNYGTTLQSLLGSEPVKGESYVVWCIDKFDNYGTEYYGDVFYTVVVIPDLKIEATEVTFEDATISIRAKGIAKYYGGMANAKEYNVDDVLTEINDWNEGVLVNGDYEGLLSKYAPAWTGATNRLQAGETYRVYAIPYVEGKTYTQEDVYSIEVTIKSITTGGTAVVTVGEVNATMTSVAAQVTRGNGTYKYWASYLSDTDMQKYPTDELMVAYLTGKTAISVETYTITSSNLAPDTKGWFVAVGVDTDGMAGTIVKKEANTSSLTYSSLTLSQPTTTVGLKEVSIVFPATAGIKQYKYIDTTLAGWNNSYVWSKTNDDGTRSGDETVTESKLAIQASPTYDYKFADAANDGSLTLNLTGKTTATDYVFFAVGVDENGNPTKMIRVDYTPQIASASYIAATDDKYSSVTVSAIQVNNKLISEYRQDEYKALTGFLSFSCEVILPKNCQKYWVFLNDGASIAGVSRRAQTGSIISNYYAIEQESTKTNVEFEWFSAAYNIYVVWQDTDGYYYEYQKIDLAEMTQQAED